MVELVKQRLDVHNSRENVPTQFQMKCSDGCWAVKCKLLKGLKSTCCIPFYKMLPHCWLIISIIIINLSPHTVSSRNVQSSESFSRKPSASDSSKSSGRPERSDWAGCFWTRRCCRYGWRRRTITETTWTYWCDTSESISAPSTTAFTPPSH